MGVVVVCGAAAVAALVLALRWRDYDVASNPGARELGTTRAQGLARVLTVGSSAGLVTGTLFIGPAGRLAMRLLAATSPDARGMITEADEVVGRITVGGTVGFVVFVGLPSGLAVGLVYAFLARAFPRGLLGGAVYGAVLLVLFSWFLEPLRSGNPDFDIIGPGWLVVLTFAVMAVLTGLVVVPVAGRIDAALGEPSPRWLWWMVPIGLLAGVSLPFFWPALVIVVIGSLAHLVLPSSGGARVRPWVLPVVVGAAVIAALPPFLSSVMDLA